MGTVIFIVLVAFGIIAIAIWLVLTRGLQLKQLLEDGVDGEGTVIRQFKHNPQSGSQSTNFFLRYRYRDDSGVEHQYKSNVSREFWAEHPEGSNIAIVYSRSKPQISAPRFLVEQARGAFAEKDN